MDYTIEEKIIIFKNKKGIKYPVLFHNQYKSIDIITFEHKIEKKQSDRVNDIFKEISNEKEYDVISSDTFAKELISISKIYGIIIFTYESEGEVAVRGKVPKNIFIIKYSEFKNQFSQIIKNHE